MTRETMRITGMTCAGCQTKIERKLLETAGVQIASVSFSRGTAVLAYDPGTVTRGDITALIGALGYEVLPDERPQKNAVRAAGILILLLAAFLLLRHFGVMDFFNIFPTAQAGMGYGMLFVIGLLTSVHCVGMCGGINLSQCIPRAAAQDTAGKYAALRPSFLYNLGRVLSYTLIGGVVGALGSAISFTGAMRGAVQLIAGLFMVFMGLNMLGIFPFLRKFIPRMPRFFAQRISTEKSSGRSPLYVGLLNGLMPCGPLQAMQIYALSTGSAAQGALSMLLFSLGTVPLMFLLGALSSVLSRRFTRRVMTAGAALVIVLGVSMFSQGWALSGFPSLPPEAASGLDAAEASQTLPSTAPVTAAEESYQSISSQLSSRAYPAITVTAGKPVRWTITAPPGSINGCNNVMVIPEYNLQYAFLSGENVIEFTPEKTGTFTYTCWMGMIRSTITVVEQTP